MGGDRDGADDVVRRRDRTDVLYSRDGRQTSCRWGNWCARNTVQPSTLGASAAARSSAWSHVTARTARRPPASPDRGSRARQPAILSVNDGVQLRWSGQFLPTFSGEVTDAEGRRRAGQNRSGARSAACSAMVLTSRAARWTQPDHVDGDEQRGLLADHDHGVCRRRCARVSGADVSVASGEVSCRCCTRRVRGANRAACRQQRRRRRAQLDREQRRYLAYARRGRACRRQQRHGNRHAGADRSGRESPPRASSRSACRWGTWSRPCRPQPTRPGPAEERPTCRWCGRTRRSCTPAAVEHASMDCQGRYRRPR